MNPVRLCWLYPLLVAVCVWWSGSAHALIIGTTSTGYSYFPNGPFLASPVAAESQAPPSQKIKYCATDNYFHGHDYYNGDLDPPCAGPTYGQPFTSVVLSCPANATGAAVCTCNAGYTDIGNVCVSNAASTAKGVAQDLSALASLNGGWVVGDRANGLGFCYQGYALRGNFGAVSEKGDYMVQGPFTSDGSTCSGNTAAVPSPATPASAAASTLAQSCTGYFGYVNGAEKCISQVPSMGSVVTAPIAGTQSTVGGSTVTKTGAVDCVQGQCSVTTTTTTVNNTGGSSSVTTTGKQSQGDFCAESPNSPVCGGLVHDKPFGELPSLYKPKYPDGIASAWAARKTELMQSSIGALSTSLMPNIAADGSCPSFVLGLNFGPRMSYGSHDLAPPCWVWGFAKAVVIISSLLLARRLIFGG